MIICDVRFHLNYKIKGKQSKYMCIKHVTVNDIRDGRE